MTEEERFQQSIRDEALVDELRFARAFGTWPLTRVSKVHDPNFEVHETPQEKQYMTSFMKRHQE